MLQAPPPQPMSFGSPLGIKHRNYVYYPSNLSPFLWTGASLMDPGAVGQALLQQQAVQGQQVLQQLHQQGALPRNGYPWN